MSLTELAPIPDDDLPLDAFRAHLRLSSGFADDTTQDGLLAQYLRAALAQVEARTGRALFQRVFGLRLGAWREPDMQPLPVAPVAALVSVTMIAPDGHETPVPLAQVHLQADGLRPRLVPVGVLLPAIPRRGQVRVTFLAGFGPDWSDLPADLRQAVLLLAAQAYEGRDTGAAPGADFGVQALLARWRPVRLGGGA